MLNSGSQLPRRIERDLKWAYKALIENDRTKGKGNDIELYHQLLRAELPVGEIVTKITSMSLVDSQKEAGAVRNVPKSPERDATSTSVLSRIRSMPEGNVQNVMRAAVASTPEGLANRAISRQRPTDMSALEVRAPDLPMRQAPTVHRNSQERFSFTRNRRMPKRIAFWLAYGVVVAATSISGCLLVRGMRYPSTEVSAYLVAALEKLNTIATPFLNVGNASPPTQHEPGWVEPDLAIALNPVTNTQAALADVPGVEPALADAAPAALAPGEEVRQEYAEGIAITREGSSSEKSGAKTTAAPPAGTLEERLGATSGASATEPSSLSVQNQSLAKELSEESASSRSRSAALAIASETEKTSSTQAAIIVPTMKRDDQRLSALETETLLSRGNALLSTGDFASARLFYEFAVERGSSTAALRLGATFDPAFIRQAPLIRVTGDLEKALYWYRRARDLGSSEADALLRSRETAAE